jgi:hypothetical protein
LSWPLRLPCIKLEMTGAFMPPSPRFTTLESLGFSSFLILVLDCGESKYSVVLAPEDTLFVVATMKLVQLLGQELV